MDADARLRLAERIALAEVLKAEEQAGRTLQRR